MARRSGTLRWIRSLGQDVYTPRREEGGILQRKPLKRAVPSEAKSPGPLWGGRPFRSRCSRYRYLCERHKCCLRGAGLFGKRY